MQENTSQSELVNVPLTGADKVAYAFYATAATAALVGQVWAGVTHIPWPHEGFPVGLRILLVAPAVAVIELGGVATAALADLRRRKGEQAYAYRAMSLFAALVALVFNVVGHWRPEERFLAFGFGGLSAFGYVLWLIHSSARRRDALRQAGQMAKTGPVYGVVQWVREPKVTWLARSLALEHGYGLYESLRQAREQIRMTARRVAIAGTVAEFIRSEQQDERLAKIAETTYDPDKLAGMLEERVNYETVTARLTRAIAPAPDTHLDQERTDLRASVWVVEGSARADQLGPGVPLRGADDRWSEAVGELTAAEFVPYDLSSDEPDVVVDGSDSEQPTERIGDQDQSVTMPAARLVVTPPATAVVPPVVESVVTAAPDPAGTRSDRSAGTPGAQPAATPAPASAAKPATRSAAKSATRPAKSAVRSAAKSTSRPAAVANEPEQTVLPITSVETVTPEEPIVVAREVAARTRPASTSSRPAAKPRAARTTRTTDAATSQAEDASASRAAEAQAVEPVEASVGRASTTPSVTATAGGQERDTDKMKMRAWALLSDWPADRALTAATLAYAITSSESYASQLIRQYDLEHPGSDRTLVGSLRPQQ